MTTIVVKDNIMASDSLSTSGGTRVGGVKKIHFLPNRGVIGIAGDLNPTFKILGILNEAITAGIDLNEVEMPEGEYTILYLDPSGQLWHAGDNLGFVPIEQPAAIGSGAEVAYGALDAGRNAENSCKIAIGRDIYSGGPIQILSIEDRK